MVERLREMREGRRERIEKGSRERIEIERKEKEKETKGNLDTNLKRTLASACSASSRHCGTPPKT